MKRSAIGWFVGGVALALAAGAAALVLGIAGDVRDQDFSLDGSRASFKSGGVVQIDKLSLNYPNGTAGDQIVSVDVQAGPGARPTTIDANLKAFGAGVRVDDRAYWTESSYRFEGDDDLREEPDWKAGEKYSVVVSVGFRFRLLGIPLEAVEVYSAETAAAITAPIDDVSLTFHRIRF